MLKISWAVPNNVVPKKMDETNGDNVDIISPEDGQSRIEDEEEEEESEDRSWRR